MSIVNEMVFQLMDCFYKGFINRSGEFIATNDHHECDAWFGLKNCETKEDLMYKVVSCMSRPAYKSEPWSTKKKNTEFHEYIRESMNRYLDTDFDEYDCEMLYQLFGNGLHENECREFISRGFDMEYLYELYKEVNKWKYSEEL